MTAIRRQAAEGELAAKELGVGKAFTCRRTSAPQYDARRATLFAILDCGYQIVHAARPTGQSGGMRKISNGGGELLFPNRRFAAAGSDDVASIGGDARPSRSNTSGLVARNTGYAALRGSPLHDNLAAFKAGADVKELPRWSSING